MESRIEGLLAELGRQPGVGDPRKADELVRLLVELYGAGLERVVEIVTERLPADELERLATDVSCPACWCCTTCTR